MTLFLILLAVVLLLGAFYLGIVVGIKDCKKQFNIPKKATGVCEDGEFIYN